MQRSAERGAISLPIVMFGGALALGFGLALRGGATPPPADTGDTAADSGTADSGAADGGPVDSGGADGGPVDSGAGDGVDTAAEDSGGACDSGVDGCVQIAGGSDLAGEKGGCGCAAERAGAGGGLWALLALGGLALRRRRPV